MAEHDLDAWLPDATLRLHHERRAAPSTSPEALWRAAQAVRITDAGTLGRLIRWRIPGTPREMTFGELFRQPPFTVLDEAEHTLIAGLVGRIWTLRRDYPHLRGPAEFRAWDRSGTARVAFAHRVLTGDAGDGPRLVTEARVEAIGLQGRIGVGAVAPLVNRFGGLVGSEGLAAAIRLAERG